MNVIIPYASMNLYILPFNAVRNIPKNNTLFNNIRARSTLLFVWTKYLIFPINKPNINNSINNFFRLILYSGIIKSENAETIFARLIITRLIN